MSWNFIPRAFRQSGDKPLAVEAPHAQDRVLAPVATHAPTFISRQPIFDAQQKIQAYQLLIRDNPIASEAAAQNPTQSAQLILDTLNNFGLVTVVGDRQAFVAAPDGTLESDLIELIPKERFVLEYPALYVQTPTGHTRCENLIQRGYSLAYVCDPVRPVSENFKQIATHVIYDLAHHTMQDIARLDRITRPSGVVRVIRGVNARAEFDQAKILHCDLYQGNMYMQADTVASNRLDPTRGRVIDIFNLVANRADVSLIEDAFKHDVALCYSLLCYINSVGIGLQYKVSSIKNAIMLLGYDFLWRWLSLLIYAGIDLSAAQRPLLNTAIIRGRMAELLGQKTLSDKDANPLFVTGMFTLLDVLLGISLDEAIKRLNVPAEVRDALVNKTGRYAPYVELAIAFEHKNMARAAKLASDIGITLDDATRAHLSAMEWARGLAK